MVIRESAEDYLEAIYMIKKRQGAVRGIDIANELGFSKPSVSVAMKNFREAGYITVDTNNYIELTDKGLEIAEKIYERHHVVAEMLIFFGVPEDIAYEDSCKIEHALSDESFEKIKEHLTQHKDHAVKMAADQGYIK